MCSIIGLYSKQNQDVSELALKMFSSLQHRGKEAFGFKNPKTEGKSRELKKLKIPKTNLLLGHSLLSVTGYSEQPITKENVSISHNGQIYNYKDFSDVKNDSGVIANFFSEELKKNSFTSAVKKFMEKTEGEYAVGVLHKKKLFAFRDFLGLKPVWFGENENIFAFASEPGALMKIDIQFPQPLKPGHYLEIDTKGILTKKIFDVNDFKKIIPKNSSVKKLKKEFDKTIELETQGLEKAAVLFSGGIDSTLIAKAVSLKVPNTKLFVAGTKESHDIIQAESAAKELNLPLEKVLLNKDDVQRLSLKAAKILSFFDEMQIGIGVPELACAERISKEGFKVVFSGQASDEIFCGYTNYARILEKENYKAVEAEIWFSLSKMWSRNFYRDDLMLASQSLELRLPLISKNFLKEAMAIPASHKIKSGKDEIRKHPLREIAKSYGIPTSILSKPKKAMQYGSGSQKIVSKLFNS